MLKIPPFPSLKSVFDPPGQGSKYPPRPGHSLKVIHRGCMLVKWNSPIERTMITLFVIILTDNGMDHSDMLPPLFPLLHITMPSA